MVGRAALGRPWVFREINHYLETGRELPPLPLNEIAELILEHARLLTPTDGEGRAILKMRGILSRYTKGWKRGGELRRELSGINTYSDLENLLDSYRSRYPE